ncbi:MAG: DUF2262 domain-containing protein [Ruminococcus sp.]|nr:DUF2262 domain-containing protein [Ruminococcus sp.]
MGRIGMENVPERVNKRFHPEEKEFLVMTISGTHGSQWNGQDYWDKSVDILGYVEIESGRTSDIKSSLDWCVKDWSYDNFKKTGTIYRIKGRLPKLLDGDEPWINNKQRMSSLYVTEIISENEKNDFLENLLAEYRKEVSVQSAVLGKLILDKSLNQYETESEIEWCGETVKISISVDEDEDNVNEILPVAEEFYNNRNEWNTKLREFSASQLTELANDWLDEEYYEDDDEESDEETKPVHEITEKEFAERITICDISFDSDGDFTVYYDDDDMFWGHSVVVYGNIKTGFEEAQLMG